MNQNQQLQQCIRDCQQTISQLQSLANQANEQKLKATLNESAHHLQMCVHECEYASRQSP